MEFEQTIISDDKQEIIQEETFEYQDDTVINQEDYKYTKIDCLDEDKVIPNQRYALLSFISPEGVMNCKIRGVKVRGVFATADEAKFACEKLKKKDKYFDVFVGEVGKWLPWDSLKQSEEVKFRNERLDKIMQKTHSTNTQTSQLENLNELVGRKKELLDKEKGNHKARVKDAIKENMENLEEHKTEEQPIKEKQKVNNPHDGSSVRNRLKKLVEEREKNKATSNYQTNLKKKQEAVIDHYKNNLKNESDRIVEKKNNVSSLEDKSNDLAEKINLMKKYKENLLNKK